MSSSFSFLDLNGSGIRDEGEPAGPLPVISQHRLGGGQVILIADPSLFINSMEALEGNRSFIRNIAATATGGLYLDQSHLPRSDLHRTKTLLTRVRDRLASLPATTLLVILVLAIALKPLWHQKKSDKLS